AYISNNNDTRSSTLEVLDSLTKLLQHALPEGKRFPVRCLDIAHSLARGEGTSAAVNLNDPCSGSIKDPFKFNQAQNLTSVLECLANGARYVIRQLDAVDVPDHERITL